MKIFIVIPAFNEQPRLPMLLSKLRSVFPLSRVVIVDDGSEAPLEIPRRYPVTLLRHQLNLGKGAAMKTGADYAFASGADAVIYMDADLQHDPKEIPVFIKHLQQGTDLVFGSRTYSAGDPHDRHLGNFLARIYCRLVFGVRIRDILSGYRALTRKAYLLSKWQSDRYGVETEMIARFSRHQHKLKWVEIPIDTIYINKYKGISPADSVKILANSLWWKLF